MFHGPHLFAAAVATSEDEGVPINGDRLSAEALHMRILQARSELLQQSVDAHRLAYVSIMLPNRGLDYTKKNLTYTGVLNTFARDGGGACGRFRISTSHSLEARDGYTHPLLSGRFAVCLLRRMKWPYRFPEIQKNRGVRRTRGQTPGSKNM